MANICSTDYYIHGSESGLEKLYNFINSENGVLYNIIGALTKCNPDKIDCCRAEVMSYDIHHEKGRVSYVTLSVDSAWVPPVKAMDKLCKALGLTNNYLAVEPGCEIFQKRDADGDFSHVKYVVDAVGDDLDNYGLTQYESVKEIVDAYAKELSAAGFKNVTTLEELEKAFKAMSDNDNYLMVHEVEALN